MLSMRQDKNGTLVITASGKLCKADYDAFTPEFERLARKQGPLRILLVLDDFHGWDLPGLWEELKFDTQHMKDMGKVAILGDAAWQEWGTRLGSPFFRAEVRYFQRSNDAEARSWLAAR